MGYLSEAMGIPQFAARADNERDDLHVYRPSALDKMGPHRAGVEAAIAQRMGAIQADIAAQRQATEKAHVAALSPAQCAAIERRIFNQVASVGGIRHARS
jgi:hypothetical protein